MMHEAMDTRSWLFFIIYICPIVYSRWSYFCSVVDTTSNFFILGNKPVQGGIIGKVTDNTKFILEHSKKT